MTTPQTWLWIRNLTMQDYCNNHSKYRNLRDESNNLIDMSAADSHAVRRRQRIGPSASLRAELRRA